ncbi:AMP-binding protein [Rhodococcus hoagii]|nr:AMP-binding protein [Prescottella equi]
MTRRFSTTLDVAVGDFATDPRKLDGLSVSELVRHWALTIGERIAFITPDSRISWASYDATTDRIASALAAVGEDSAVALYLPDTMVFHAALCAAYRTGRIAVGIGSRSGVKEVAHLSTRAGCRTLVTTRSLRGQDTAALVAQLRERTGGPEHVIYVDDLAPSRSRTPPANGSRSPTADSTPPAHVSASTTFRCSTPRPAPPSAEAGDPDRAPLDRVLRGGRAGRRITGDDVFFGAVPAPFGFGLWTSHFLPALLGAPNVVVERFNADVMVDLLERERVTILNCVSTQFKMLLRSERAQAADLGALRAMFTGGEAVPYSEALAFEERTGAAVLQFYGSNETGAVSVTTVDDDADTRLRTCGRVVDEARVRVFDDAGTEVLGAERRGQPGVNGPLTCHGYWDDDAANAELYTDDGWMLLGDIVEIDAAGRLRVVGRKADIIIRGGKNISAVEVEEFVRAHPAVTMVAVVGVHDALFGEKVCAVVVTADGTELTADDLSSWLAAQGVTREYTPEHVVTVDELPLAPGGRSPRGS